MKRLGGLLFVLALVAAGCGGGGSSNAPTQQVQLAPGSATIIIPNRTSSSTSRGPQFVASTVVSARIAIASLADQTFDLSTSSSLCTTASTGRTCTITFSAPVGQSNATVTLYDHSGGTGSILGTVQTSITFTAQGPNSVSFTVNGQVAAFTVKSSQNLQSGVGCVVVGSPGSTVFTFTATDADGNIITGPGNFASPIVLTASSTVFSFSPSSITGPGQPSSTASYNGQPFTSPGTITASVGNFSMSLPVYAGTGSTNNCTLPSGTPTSTPNTGPSPSPTPTSSPSTTPSPSPTPSPAPSTTVAPNCGSPLPLPNTYTSVFTFGTLSASGTTYTANSAQSNWNTYMYTATSPTPTPTASPMPSPSPSPTRTPQPIYVYTGTYQLSMGTHGCFFLTTSQDGSPLTAFSGGSFQGDSGFGNGSPNVTGSYTQTFVAAGSINSLVITNLSAAGGSGTMSLSNGDSGTISLTSRQSSTLDEIRRTVGADRR